jgi:hypothetical protein
MKESFYNVAAACRELGIDDDRAQELADAVVAVVAKDPAVEAVASILQDGELQIWTVTRPGYKLRAEPGLYLVGGAK